MTGRLGSPAWLQGKPQQAQQLSEQDISLSSFSLLPFSFRDLKEKELQQENPHQGHWYSSQEWVSSNGNARQEDPRAEGWGCLEQGVLK